jgi:hypothetical protein
MGPSQGLTSNAWEVTSMPDVATMNRSQTAAADAREVMDMLLSMEFDG